MALALSPVINEYNVCVATPLTAMLFPWQTNIVKLPRMLFSQPYQKTGELVLLVFKLHLHSDLLYMIQNKFAIATSPRLSLQNL